MSLLLTPSIYKQGLRWNLRRANAVDTVVFSIFYNDEEISTVASGTLKRLNYNGQSFRLPLGFLKPILQDEGYSWAMIGKGRTCFYNNGPYDYAWGQTALLLGDATIPITLSGPASNLAVTINIKGVTTQTTNSDRENYSNPRNGGYTSADIVTMISSHSPTVSSEWSNSSEYKDYNSPNGIDINPFVKQSIKANGEDPQSANLTPANELITRWNGYNGNTPLYWSCASSGRTAGWEGTRYSDSNQQRGSSVVGKTYQWPATIYDKRAGGTEASAQRASSIYTGKVKLKRELTKIDDYNYSLYITEPLRFIYQAYAEYNYSNWILVEEGNAFLDAKAFYDDITEVSYTIEGYRISARTEEYSYSLSTDRTITTESKNINVLRIPESIFMTANSGFNSGVITCSPSIVAGTHNVGDTQSGSTTSWADFWPIRILNYYSKGKYVVEVEVPAIWAVKNKVKVGTSCQVKLPNGKYISTYYRNGYHPCELIVKNITKSYRNNQFQFRLQLTEKGLYDVYE